MYPRIQKTIRILIAAAGVCAFFTAAPSEAQAPGRGPAPGPAAQAPKAPPANLAQLMRGTLYPASNVIFAAQSQDPEKVPQDADPSTATNPLASTYGKWQAVENAALALSEVATLLTVPGRKCSNGIAVPLRNADWAKFIQGLRDAGATALKAAQAKDQDKILDAASDVSTACSNCHDKYREKPNLADRCK